MKVNKKVCKGINKAKGYPGCGELVYRFKYGLCKPCYYTFLRSTDAGNEIIKKSIIQAKKEVKRKEKQKTKELKESLKTHKDYLKDLQKVFNQFIRLRDKDLPCISCGTQNKVQYAAGHYYPMGNYSFLRFHEDNVHKQCNKHCNMMLSGNLIEYRKGLIKKIGKEKLQWLDDHRHDELKLSIPEIKELIKNYKSKIKTLKK